MQYSILIRFHKEKHTDAQLIRNGISFITDHSHPVKLPSLVERSEASTIIDIQIPYFNIYIACFYLSDMFTFLINANLDHDITTMMLL